MGIETLFPQLIRAGLDGDSRTIRSLAMRIIRRLKDTHPDVAHELAEALSVHAVGMSSRSSIGMAGAPVDGDSRKSLAVVEEPIEHDRPVFNSKINSILDDFIKERNQSAKLLAAGLTPPSSLLVYGPPGVGKTLLAKYLSSVFSLNFVTLDLATSISSYLGKTGQNLKSVLDYSRSHPCILLLDEFDAVAKKRDDTSDLGELKRIVNVLLKELEDWPTHSIIMAATNHPDLLDKAIWRRFDRTIEIELPGKVERCEILKAELSSSPSQLMELVGELTDGLSCADICKLAQRVQRKMIIDEVGFTETLIRELTEFTGMDNVEFNKKFCHLAKNELGVSIGTLATWLQKSRSTIQYYLKQKGDK